MVACTFWHINGYTRVILTKSVNKSKKYEGFCSRLIFFHYLCRDSLMSLENLTL